MTSQQNIDFAEIFAQIDKDFPVKPKTVPTQDTEAVFYPDWAKYRGQVSEWLKEVPAPVSDTQIVSFVRVTRTMAYQGARLHRSKPKSVPDGVDAHEWIQTFADRCGGGMEAYNADGSVVAKFVPSENIKPGRAFI